MATFREALSSSIRGAVCSTAATAEGLWGLVGTAVDNSVLGSPPVNLPAAIGRGAGVIAGLACNKEPIPPPDPEFQGGQCPGTIYVPEGDGIDTLGRPNTFRLIPGGPGPISSFRALGNGDIEVVYADGPFVYSRGIQTIQSFTPVPSPGQPDDCGNPPPVAPPLPPSIPTGIPDDVTFTPDSGPDITIPVVIFAGFAYVDIDADIKIPVRVNVDTDIDLFADFNLNTGDISFNFGNRTTNIDRCKDVPTEDIPDPPEDEETTTSRIIGVVVVVSTTVFPNPIDVIPQQGGNPDIIVPDAGLVNFLIETGSGAGGPAWTQDFRVKTRVQYIPVPVPFGALRVRGTPRPGVAFTLRSVRAAILESTFPV